MSEKIEGISKEDLLRLSIVFHDLGKFTDRKVKTKDQKNYYVSFRGHEQSSKNLILEDRISSALKGNFGLTDAQIEYIAKCAELHYALGLVRNELRGNSGYTLSSLSSNEFFTTLNKLMENNPWYELEIGTLFLADSLAKTEIRIKKNPSDQGKNPVPNTIFVEELDDMSLQGVKQQITEMLVNRGLNPKLVEAIIQLPINIAVAESYLKLWARKGKI